MSLTRHFRLSWASFKTVITAQSPSVPFFPLKEPRHIAKTVTLRSEREKLNPAKYSSDHHRAFALSRCPCLVPREHARNREAAPPPRRRRWRRRAAQNTRPTAERSCSTSGTPVLGCNFGAFPETPPSVSSKKVWQLLQKLRKFPF